ncbi:MULTISPECIES: YchJ family protein [unclassified Streptomyces]|uniref:YchJ family protein n=1 Tax=unclassified Streptomyces TaxID=2593676 RepID=UPI00278C2895|nr:MULTISPECIES: YchJ family metal-binding protein [unclassified Streptomyces]
MSRISPTPTTCPCGLPVGYEECCGRYHSGRAAAPTAEALMRSRYVAFVRQDAPYLLRTWHPDTRPPGIDFGDAPEWTGLEIVEAGDGSAFHQRGTVTFRARYKGGELHERSRFSRVGGAWVYVDGDFID